MAQELGVGDRISHETHRGRSLGSPWMAGEVVSALPTLPLTADLSHWTVASERLLQPSDARNAALLEAVLGNVRHIHGRVGTAQSPQQHGVVESQERRWFEMLWGRVWDAQYRRGVPVTTFTAGLCRRRRSRGIASLSRCVSINVSSRSLWLCGCVAVWLCGCVAVWLLCQSMGHTRMPLWAPQVRLWMRW